MHLGKTYMQAPSLRQIWVATQWPNVLPQELKLVVDGWSGFGTKPTWTTGRGVTAGTRFAPIFGGYAGVFQSGGSEYPYESSINLSIDSSWSGNYASIALDNLGEAVSIFVKHLAPGQSFLATKYYRGVDWTPGFGEVQYPTTWFMFLPYLWTDPTPAPQWPTP